MSKIQAVYALQSDGWSAALLLKWIKQHNLQPIKRVHYVGDSIRYRINEPNPNKKYYTQMLPNGVHLVIQK